MTNIVVQALKKQLEVLDEEYQQNRKALLDAIKQHGGGVASADNQRPNLSGGFTHGIVPFNGPAPKLIGTNVRSISDAIREAVVNINGDFTLNTIREYIKEHFQHIYHSTNPKSIGARLWEACDEGLIELVSPGRGGKPNIYALKAKIA